MTITKKKYREEIKESINNEFLQKVLGNFIKSFPKAREKAFEGYNTEKMISNIAAMKTENIAKMEELFQQFKNKAEGKGVKVYLAKDAEEANTIIAEIAKQNNVREIIKSKSMTSEEIHLNKHLEAQGFNIVETDLGEWIIQLRREGPSHMVLPAIHLSRTQVAELFSEVTKEKQPEDIDHLVKVARKELRQRYLDADMGITGVNVAIAETGTIALVTNEGNARLISTLPKVHVALAGMEKLVATVDDALQIINILPKNATGQNITSYITWITGRNENSSNEDKQANHHIVFLDNGRINLAKDAQFKEILNCVRCGACANVCPVYGSIGGHKMGYKYIGPIGLLLTYFHHGKENAKNIIYNCTNCLACEKICASGIPIPSLIQDVQTQISKEEGRPATSKLVGKIMSNRKLFHSFLKMGKTAQLPFKGKGQFIRHLPNLLFIKDQKFKSLPALADKSLREEWDKIKPNVKNPKYKIGLFAGCLNDFVYPEQVKASIHLFEENNASLYFPKTQNCCGLPLKINSDIENTKVIVKQNVKAFQNGKFDHIVTFCASCASFLKNEYPKLMDDKKLAQEFSDKIIDYSSLMNDVFKIKKKDKKQKKVAYHAPCHLCRGMGVTEAPIELIKKAGYEYIPTEGEKTCCGFGGTYSMKFPEISEHIMNKKLDVIKNTDAEILVTDCPGCIMQLKGGADKRNDKFEVIHISEL